MYRLNSLLSVAAIFINLFFAASAYAAPLPGVDTTNINAFITAVLCQVAVYMFYILMALAVVFVLVAAYRYLTSSGEEEKVRQATRTITYAAVAIAVSLVAKGFPLIIITIFPNVTGIGSNTPICP